MNRYFSRQSTQHQNTAARHADGSAASPSPCRTPNRPVGNRSSRPGRRLVVWIAALLSALSWPAASPAQESGKARTVEIYARVLGDSSQDIERRIKTCQQLVEVGPEAAAAVPALIKVLDYRGKHVVPYTVYRGSGVREEIRTADGVLVTDIRNLVLSESSERKQDVLVEDRGLVLRSEAARALKAIRPPAEHIMPAVIEILERTPKESWSLKAATEQREEWIDRFGAFKRSYVSLEPLCVELIDLLAEYGTEAGDAVPVLLKAAEGKLSAATELPAFFNCSCPSHSRQRLIYYPTGWQPNGFTYSIGPHQTTGRKHAVEALGKIGSEKAIELLEEIALLADDSPSLKTAAQEALSQIQRQDRK